MTTGTQTGTFIDERRIKEAIERNANPSKETIREVLSKGRALAGLDLEETAVLLNAEGEDLRAKIFDTAAHIKKTIYGDRLVFFAPLYLSNYCVNDCGYCGFHSSNGSERKKLTFAEMRSEVERLIEMGHKRLLLEAGEDPANNPIEYVLDAIDTIYSVRTGKGEIRRLNVNIAATSVENYRRLKDRGIGTY
ncbi:MAG: [FeFe] hydrogenase H-cluster radical SAM maturase HydG, partial [Deltaproteobacteria bacterium]|nr:[FeFe] hydrogenase H-cluster radical SAM maturase HydG [Deltaproteobacteria bacterium]